MTLPRESASAAYHVSALYEEASDWLEFFREVANPRTTKERWRYLDEAATYVERLLDELEKPWRWRSVYRAALQRIADSEGNNLVVDGVVYGASMYAKHVLAEVDPDA